MKINTEQLVITALTGIAMSTLISMTITIVIINIYDLEVLALFFNVISNVTGSLAGFYMGRRLNDPELSNRGESDGGSF